VVDVEHGALRALEQDALAAAQRSVISRPVSVMSGSSRSRFASTPVDDRGGSSGSAPAAASRSLARSAARAMSSRARAASCRSATRTPTRATLSS
jgi:hypothetical protein